MLIGLSAPDMALLASAGIILDWFFGELPRWHPLVGFGRCADRLEQILNCNRHRFLRGLLAWMLATLPVVGFAYWIAGCARIGLLIHAVLLYFCLGLRSLRDHNLPISQALLKNDLAHARILTSRVVSRDTRQASTADLARASTESLLENGNDAVFGTLFWFILAGGAGALLFRLVNTLDAMWGYRTPRFLQFGRAAARIDDAMNWAPARLTALSYVLLAATRADKARAWRCWRQQAPAWPSPNAGPVIASGAGALGLALGGVATYDGVTELQPTLGIGRPAQAEDIIRAWRLVAAAAVLWIILMALGGAWIFLS